ncbi:MAG: hypothetical protein KF730_13115 [Sphingomonas sp.]|uniref:hypothetical protein n=1 Tax=Sphingomonas sp. TaxID=28214 RepID=UPI0025DB76F7|nr:hypothetical protein [Sphingomonas sp.]MBX3565503.1 hypothetical protein [Sphingomonas sp.]
MRALLLPVFLVLSVAGCARGSRPAEIASPLPPPVARAMPVPPASAAPNLKLPDRLADGSYVTPNRNLSDAAVVWHVRSALNVAVLGCPQGQSLAANYNRLLQAQRGAFASAHRRLAAEYRGGDFDAAMTRVYNYFSQPPAQRDFCPVAADVLAQAIVAPPAEFDGFARAALLRLDAPFIAFYRAYDAYRADLAQWRAGLQPPQITYEGGEFLRDDRLAGGAPAKILATR